MCIWYIYIYIHISPANARIEDLRVLICFGDQLSLVSGSQAASVSWFPRGWFSSYCIYFKTFFGSVAPRWMTRSPNPPMDDPYPQRGCKKVKSILLPTQFWLFFPTCQVRVVRFYVSCFLLVLVLLLLLPLLVLLLLLLLSSLLLSSPRLLSSCSLPDFNHDHPRPVCPAGPQPRPSTPSVPCRTSTASIRAQCSLPDLNHDHPRPVFPAGPQPRGSMPSVPCRTSCRKIWDKECAEES